MVRFEGDEVYVTRDERTGDVRLSTHPCARSWAEFFDFLRRRSRRKLALIPPSQ